MVILVVGILGFFQPKKPFFSMNDFTPYIERDRKNFWIVLFIFFSIFINSFVFFKEPFEFYIGYLIYIFLLPGFIIKYKFNRNLIFIFLTLFLVGIVGILTGNNTSSQFLKVYLGVFFSYLFYYYVVLELDFDIEQLFKWYLKGAYFASIIGIFQFISFLLNFKPGFRLFYLFNKWGIAPGGTFGIRINSVFSEPTHLGAALSAAFFVSVYNLFNSKTFYLSKFQSLVIIIVYLLSFSGLGQLGVFLTLIFILISYGFIRYLFIIIPICIILFNFLFNNVSEFRSRYEGLISMYTTGKFELGKTHGSSFILYNNYHVALENFENNFLFGSGLGSHLIAFDKYSLAKDFKTVGFNLNGADANSMLLRLISETGIFGVLIFLVIIFKCYVKRDVENLSYHWLISNALLILILLNLFRQGHYFLNGFPFFVILYYFNSVSYKNYFIEEQPILVETENQRVES